MHHGLKGTLRCGNLQPPLIGIEPRVNVRMFLPSPGMSALENRTGGVAK
jgi:hypothetical protein